jgi:hypothetical protein
MVMLITLRGRHAGDEGVEYHLHYVPLWPTGATKVARYLSTASAGVARDESIDQIETLQIDLYSDEVRTVGTVLTYTGKEYDHDVSEYCKSLDISGEWRSYEPDALFYNSGFLIHNAGDAFPCTKVTVHAKWGDKLISLSRNMNDALFPSGTDDTLAFARARYFDGPSFNRGRPESVTMTFEFPGTKHTHTLKWQIKK